MNEKVIQILNTIDSLSKNGIRNKEEISRLIEVAIMNDRLDILEDLSFHAKYLQGLLKIIQTKDEVMDDKYFVNIKSEYAEGIKKVKGLFEIILKDQSKFIIDIFTKKYFSLTQQSLTNLNSLCKDLSYLKLYFNDLKQGRE